MRSAWVCVLRQFAALWAMVNIGTAPIKVLNCYYYYYYYYYYYSTFLSTNSSTVECVLNSESKKLVIEIPFVLPLCDTWRLTGRKTLSICLSCYHHRLLRSCTVFATIMSMFQLGESPTASVVESLLLIAVTRLRAWLSVDCCYHLAVDHELIAVLEKNRMLAFCWRHWHLLEMQIKFTFLEQ